VLRPGAGDADEVPKVHDTVELHIEGYQLDGTLFESTCLPQLYTLSWVLILLVGQA
jgi:hypothetical protein